MARNAKPSAGNVEVHDFPSQDRLDCDDHVLASSSDKEEGKLCRSLRNAMEQAVCSKRWSRAPTPVVPVCTCACARPAGLGACSLNVAAVLCPH